MRTALCTLLISATSSVALGRPLTLHDAVDLALQRDPLYAEAKVVDDRSKLGVLRAQLDRFSFKIDGQLQELWNKSNIAGPTQYDSQCGLNGTSLGGLPDSWCTGLGGTNSKTLSAIQSPEAGQGLLNLRARLDVPIFSGLRVESNVENRLRVRDQAHANLRQARKDVALAAARAYWAVRRLAILRDVTQGARDRLSEAEQVAAARVKAGLAPPIDRNRAALRRVQLEARLADQRGQLQEAAVQLGVLLGVSDAVEPTEAPDFPSAIAPVAELLHDADKARPEIDSARQASLAQAQVVRIAKSSWYPQLSGFGLFQYGNNPYLLAAGSSLPSTSVNPFSNVSGSLSFGLSLSVNLFDTLNTWTSVRDAKFEQLRLSHEEKRVERVVEGDVRGAHARIVHLLGRKTPLEQTRELARDNLSILAARYKNGDALIFEFLDSQIDLINAEIDVADLEAQLSIAWIELQAALGKTIGVSL